MTARSASAALIEAGDLRLSAAFARRELREPRAGNHLGVCLLPEAGERLVHCNVYLLGTIPGPGHMLLVGVCPGRQDLFLGHWHSHPDGPSLWRLPGQSLAQPWPLEPPPRDWAEAFPERIQQVLQDMVAVTAPEAPVPAATAVGAAMDQYREVLAMLVDRALSYAGAKGYAKKAQHLAQDVDPAWTHRDLLSPTVPSVRHAILASLTTVPQWGMDTREEALACLLVQHAWLLEFGVPAPRDTSVKELLRDMAGQLTFAEPRWARSGIFLSWDVVRKETGNPHWGIRRALETLALRRAEAAAQVGAVNYAPPPAWGHVRRGGFNDGRDRRPSAP